MKSVVIREVHDILYYVNKDDPNGPAPTDPTVDPMYSRWEKPVQAWAKKNNYVSTAPPYESCGLRTTQGGPVVVITNPLAGSTVSTTLPVSVTVGPTVVSVQYSLDDRILATTTAAPFDATLDVSTFSNGFHVLRATASDAAGVTAGSEVTINVLADKTLPATYFLSLHSGSTVSQASLPQLVKAFAYDPDGVAQVTLSMRAPDGTVSVLDSIDSPPDTTVNLSWPTTAPGSYQLQLTIKSKKGRTTTSDYLPVTVTK